MDRCGLRNEPIWFEIGLLFVASGDVQEAPMPTIPRDFFLRFVVRSPRNVYVTIRRQETKRGTTNSNFSLNVVFSIWLGLGLELGLGLGLGLGECE